MGDENDQFEVPDQSEIFDFGTRLLDALQQRWNELETVLARADTDDANFHPLTKHFFVKALSEHGVDEILSNLSCLKASLQLKQEKNRTKLTQRFASLVADDQAALWLEATYRLRNDYLHSVGDPEVCRQLVAIAVVAMEIGGRMEVSVARTNVNADSARTHGLAAGTHVRISGAERGTGIPPNLQSHVFEPFFTTKEAGDGKGLAYRATRNSSCTHVFPLNIASAWA